MAKHPRRSKGKEINPTFFVFCEGESEEAYISFIRSKYRVSIQIKSKVAKNKINQQYVNRILNALPKHVKDKFFLFYDLDVPEILERLRSIKDAILLVSNPCLELWYILHTCNHNSVSSSQQIISQLDRICRGYRKGSICTRLKHELSTGEEQACRRAKLLKKYSNPSTTVYQLLEQIKVFAVNQ